MLILKEFLDSDKDIITIPIQAIEPFHDYLIDNYWEFHTMTEDDWTLNFAYYFIRRDVEWALCISGNLFEGAMYLSKVRE